LSTAGLLSESALCADNWSEVELIGMGTAKQIPIIRIRSAGQVRQ